MADLKLDNIDKKKSITELENEIKTIKRNVNSNLLKMSDIDLKRIEDNYNCGFIDIQEATKQRAMIYTNLAKELYPFEEVNIER